MTESEGRPTPTEKLLADYQRRNDELIDQFQRDVHSDIKEVTDKVFGNFMRVWLALGVGFVLGYLARSYLG